MVNEQILKKAIEKAVEGGYPMAKSCYDYAIKVMTYFDKEYIWTMIFDHRFAKAFWGRNNIVLVAPLADRTNMTKKELAWQFHLQRMVLEEEPLKYLEKFLEVKV